MPKIREEKDKYDVELGGFQFFFMKKYHLLANINDLMLGLWFLIGSFLFLSEKTQTYGTVLFILGSAQLLGRPILKIIRAFYVRRNNSGHENFTNKNYK